MSVLTNIFQKQEGEGSSAAFTWFGVKKELLVRLALGAVIFCVGLFLPLQNGVKLVLMVLSFLVTGYDVILRAVTRIAAERSVGEELLITVAGVMAFVINAGYEAAAVMLIYQLGFVLRAYASELTRGSLRDRVDPYVAEVSLVRGEETAQVSPEQIQPDDILIVVPGERFPVDCELTLGTTKIDCGAVYGHAAEKAAVVGDLVPAGAVNLSEEVRVRAVSTYDGSVFASSLDTVSDPENLRGPAEHTVENYSRFFAPFALGLAILLALLLLIFTSIPTEEAIHRALVLLIVATPTAILAPMAITYLSGLYRSLQGGVLVKNAPVFDSLSRAGAVIFDKEDLLSPESYRVSSVKSERLDPNVLLKVAAHAASNSKKAEANSIIEAYDGVIDSSLIQRFEEFAEGIVAVIDGVVITMGGRAAMEKLHITLPEEENPDQRSVYLTLNGRFAGSIQLVEDVKNDARGCVAAIESTGCDCIMFNEDSQENAAAIASAVGIKEYYAQCMPMDRLEKIQEIKERFPVNSVLYVGRGASDESFLTAADLGVCLNGADSQDARDAGEIVVMDDSAEALAGAIEAARVTRKTVKTTTLAIIGVKALLFLLSLFGITYQLWFAAMVDVVAGVAGILYSTRVADQ